MSPKDWPQSFAISYIQISESHYNHCATLLNCNIYTLMRAAISILRCDCKTLLLERLDWLVNVTSLIAACILLHYYWFSMSKRTNKRGLLHIYLERQHAQKYSQENEQCQQTKRMIITHHAGPEVEKGWRVYSILQWPKPRYHLSHNVSDCSSTKSQFSFEFDMKIVRPRKACMVL